MLSKACRDIMAPMMWEKFSTNLQPPTTKTLTTLIQPTSGILSYIHHLDVLNTLSLPDGEDYLSLLISALPRDSLRAFASDVPIRLALVQVLLSCHRKLLGLHIDIAYKLEPKDSIILRMSQHTNWMRSLISELVNYTFKT
jgi:hypothetical protein